MTLNVGDKITIFDWLAGEPTHGEVRQAANVTGMATVLHLDGPLRGKFFGAHIADEGCTWIHGSHDVNSPIVRAMQTVRTLTNGEVSVGVMCGECGEFMVWSPDVWRCSRCGLESHEA